MYIEHACTILHKNEPRYVQAVVHKYRLPGDEPGYVKSVIHKYSLPGDEPRYVQVVVHKYRLPREEPGYVQVGMLTFSFFRKTIVSLDNADKKLVF